MKYDFTSIIDRKGKDALAVDILPNMLGPGKKVEVREGMDYIPMWVADMNFPALPKITEAIIERAKHPTYGYFITRDEYYNSIIKWHEERNHVTGLKKEHIGIFPSMVFKIVLSSSSIRGTDWRSAHVYGCCW